MRKRQRCPACERPFRNDQAVKAHLRFCHAYRLKKANAGKGSAMPEAIVSALSVEAEYKIASPPLKVDTEKPLNRRTGRQSQESLLLLLDVDELFPELKEDSQEHAAIARVFSTVRSSLAGMEDEWNKVYWSLDECHRDYQRMVIGMRLDPALLFSIYQRMLEIKQQWLSFRARALTPAEGYEMSQESCDALREEEERWTMIIDNIKKMLVASR
jgi:hypothetical protein